ncbi:MAG: glycoside hydrolase family protein, partial [Cyanobacteria bacterium J06659_2]
MPDQGYDSSSFQSGWATKPAPLEMQGGDPHIRALMRTISASESNTAEPYHVIYGGQHVKDLSQHPEICVDIASGPNAGNCSTAAGRYQFLDKT